MSDLFIDVFHAAGPPLHAFFCPHGRKARARARTCTSLGAVGMVQEAEVKMMEEVRFYVWRTASRSTHATAIGRASTDRSVGCTLTAA